MSFDEFTQIGLTACTGCASIKRKKRFFSRSKPRMGIIMKIIRVVVSKFDILDSNSCLLQILLERLDCVYGLDCFIDIRVGEFQSVKTNIGKENVKKIEEIVDQCVRDLM